MIKRHEPTFARKLRMRREPPALVAALVQRTSRAEWIIVALTFVLAFAALAAVVTAWLQWDVMERQAVQIQRQADQTDDIIEQMRSEQRAWLGLRDPKLITLAPGQAVQARLPLFNSGDTPATIKAWSTRFVGMEPGADVGPEFSKLLEDRPRQSVVPPDTPYNNEITGPVITDATAVEQIKAGTRKLYVIGRIQYQDVAGALRFTQFCFEYMPAQEALYACVDHHIMN